MPLSYSVALANLRLSQAVLRVALLGSLLLAYNTTSRGIRLRASSNLIDSNRFLPVARKLGIVRRLSLLCAFITSDL